MKRCIVAKPALILAACLLLAASVSAGGFGVRRAKKPWSIDALARALAAKLPHTSGLVVYVAPLRWKGPISNRRSHNQLRESICEKLASAFATADPTAKVFGPARAETILTKSGFPALDVYLMGGERFTALLGKTAGTEAVVLNSEIRAEENAFNLTVEALGAKRKKSLAELTASLPETPQLRALYSLPDKPIMGSDGVYLAGVGGVGLPRCIRCRSPRFPNGAIGTGVSAEVVLALTIGTDGKVTNVEVLKVTAEGGGLGFGRAAARAVVKWRFHPAKGPNGKPVPVRMLAETNFRYAG